MLIYKDIGANDIPSLFVVRIATRENAYTMDGLERLGITEASVTDMIKTTHRGWLCEVDKQVIGFAIGNRKNGEMWVIAVLPEYEGKGVGKELLIRVEDWLWSEGWNEIWLTTGIDPSLRAYRFYRSQGWIDYEIRDGLRYMKKINPNQSLKQTG
jgi:GNAT superfamily N-acetyltransferase